ncbi:Hypothetical_protein [Hexamita inflata]|uniref:Hypothetical_protein n=1 Tax=Hexamita inflata TaxID=28002 RepID=A0AA86NCE7_9EUKA|nr:Hypothetical protein HINF_LOCUS4762 [Hexamita inflata]
MLYNQNLYTKKKPFKNHENFIANSTCKTKAHKRNDELVEYSGTQVSECDITIQIVTQTSELRHHWKNDDPKEYYEQVCCDLEEVMDIYVVDNPLWCRDYKQFK